MKKRNKKQKSINRLKKQERQKKQKRYINKHKHKISIIIDNVFPFFLRWLKEMNYYNDYISCHRFILTKIHDENFNILNVIIKYNPNKKLLSIDNKDIIRYFTTWLYFSGLDHGDFIYHFDAYNMFDIHSDWMQFITHNYELLRDLI